MGGSVGASTFGVKFTPDSPAARNGSIVGAIAGFLAGFAISRIRLTR